MSNDRGATLREVLIRLYWMMLGPLLLALLAYVVIKTGNGWVTGADIGFLAVLAGLLLARWLEFRGGNPRTAEGEPATPAHLRRYVIGAATVGLAVWVGANILGNYVLVP
jgi:hypothetical protein